MKTHSAKADVARLNIVIAIGNMLFDSHGAFRQMDFLNQKNMPVNRANDNTIPNMILETGVF